jgi:hypothetical protein
MSLADHETDEPGWHEQWCVVHLDSYIDHCPHCQDDEADRQYDERREK